MVIRLSYKETRHLINQSEKCFCQAYCLDFFSILKSFFMKRIKFEKRKALKKQLNEELMRTAWHAKRWCNFFMSEDERKEMEPIN